MVGNLHEWVADNVSVRLKEEIPIEYGAHRLGSRGKAVFMGGYFSSRGEHGRGCAYATTSHAAEYHDYSTGFRCCADPGDSSEH
jgi:formylglycine-generating enzyme required for sulfatase activity